MKFIYLDHIKVVSGFYKGLVGTIIEFNSDERFRCLDAECVAFHYNIKYGISLIKTDGNLLWINEQDLEKIKD